jgi:transposase-like protein
MTENELPARRARNKHYPIAFRQEAVRLVEAGEAQGVVADRLVIGRLTLRAWLRRYGTAVYQQMKRKVFTAAQKHQIVRELRDGRLSEDEALLKYGLRLKSTLRAWVAAQQAAEATAPPPPPVVLAVATGQMAELAAQLRQAQWQIEALHTLIDQAEAAYHIDIRKKGGAKPSK